MKANIDKIYCGKKVIAGLTTTVEGRIRGSNRSRKIVNVWGKQGQQDRLRRIQYYSTAINSRYGTLGLKIQVAISRKSYFKNKRDILEYKSGLLLDSKKKETVINYNKNEI